MSVLTQLIINKLDYQQILTRLLVNRPSIKNSPDQVLTRLIIIIGLTSGLTLEEILRLKWSDILTVDSRSRPRINMKYRVDRHYEFPINVKIHAQNHFDAGGVYEL